MGNPVIARFNGIVIKMYFRQRGHNPPHIHAIYGDYMGMFSISDGEMFEVDIELFRNVKVDAGGYGISWNDDLDLAAEDIWLDGIETGKRRKLEIALVFAEKLLQAREESGMTQKQLAERTGIYQADISKLERGQGNPSLSTIKRLAEAMDLQVRIEFERRK